MLPPRSGLQVVVYRDTGPDHRPKLGGWCVRSVLWVDSRVHSVAVKDFRSEDTAMRYAQRAARNLCTVEVQPCPFEEYAPLPAADGPSAGVSVKSEPKEGIEMSKKSKKSVTPAPVAPTVEATPVAETSPAPAGETAVETSASDEPSVKSQKCSHKECEKTGKNQPAKNFYRDRSRKSGLDVWCKTCTKRHQTMRREEARLEREAKAAAAAVKAEAKERLAELLEITAKVAATPAKQARRARPAQRQAASTSKTIITSGSR